MSACTGGNSDSKIACETLADADGEQPPPDFPPESFWLSKDAEFDWFDQNAFFERKESTKGNSNSTNLNPALNSCSQRISVNKKSKPSILGLPKTQKTNYVDSTKRKNVKPANIRLFPKRSQSVGKSTVPMTEPSSPKVSCMGRVRSKKNRRKRSEPASVSGKSAERVRTGGGRKTGICRQFIALFRAERRSKPMAATKEPATVVSRPRESVTVRAREFSVEPEAASEPPGLGGMKRFASGRRSTSSAANGEE